VEEPTMKYYCRYTGERGVEKLEQSNNLRKLKEEIKAIGLLYAKIETTDPLGFETQSSVFGSWSENAFEDFISYKPNYKRA
jgi:hypothetical protein